MECTLRMRLYVFVFLFGMLLLNSLQAGFLEMPSSEMVPYPEELKAVVKREKDWQTTFNANRKRFDGELKTEKDKVVRNTRMHVRMLVLSVTLSNSFSNPEDLFRSVAQYAYAWRGLRHRERGNAALRRLIEHYPGDTSLAVKSLMIILEIVPWNEPTKSEDGLVWAEYASRRIVALNRAGAIPDAHPAMVQALQTIALVNGRYRRRYAKAEAALAALEEMGGHAAWVNQERAEILLQAGCPKESMTWLERLWQGQAVRKKVAFLERIRTPSSPTYPSDGALEALLPSLEADAAEESVHVMDELFRLLVEKDCLVAGRESRRQGAWGVVDEYLHSLPKRIAALREHQERSIGVSIQRKGAMMTLQDRMRAFRQFPYAPSVHDVLLDAGESELRKGNPGIALRCFQDVVRQSADAERQKNAQTGVLLSVAQMPKDSGSFLKELQKFPKDASVAMLGRSTRIADFQKLYQAESLEVLPADATETVRREFTLSSPRIRSWPDEILQQVPPRALAHFSILRGTVQVVGTFRLLAGPQGMALYREGEATPVWEKENPLPRSGQSRGGQAPVLLPGIFRPCIVDGVVLSRWGWDRAKCLPNQLIAFELQTGRLLWTTAKIPEVKGLTFAADPVVVGDRVIVPALTRGRQSGEQLAHLVCFSRTSGKLLWKRNVAANTSGFLLAQGHSLYKDHPLNVAGFGLPAIVHAGAVYWVSNLGGVVRCDLRDGLVEWVYSYPRISLIGLCRDRMTRLGGMRLVGNRLIVAPRDSQGVFALDTLTGELLWRKTITTSGEILAVRQDRVILRTDDTVTALAVADGATVWDRCFEEGVLGCSVISETRLGATTAKHLLVMDSFSGRLIQTRSWDRGEPLIAAVVDRGIVAGLAAAPSSVPVRNVAHGSTLLSSSPFYSVMQPSWRTQRANGVLWTEAGGSAKDFLLYAEGVAEYYPTAGANRPIWAVSVPFPNPLFSIQTDTIYVFCDTMVFALDRRSGIMRWKTDAPFQFSSWKILKNRILLSNRAIVPFQKNVGEWTRLAFLDATTGAVIWKTTFTRETEKSVWADAELQGDLLRMHGYSYSRQGTVDVQLSKKTGVCQTLQQSKAPKKSRFLGLSKAKAIYLLPSASAIQMIPFVPGVEAVRIPIPKSKTGFSGKVWDLRCQVIERGEWTYLRFHEAKWKQNTPFALLVHNAKPSRVVFVPSNATLLFQNATVYMFRYGRVCSLDAKTESWGPRYDITPVVHEERVTPFASCVRDKQIAFFSRAQRKEGKPFVRVDVFDRVSGLLKGRALIAETLAPSPSTGLYPNEHSVMWTGERLLIASPKSVNAYSFLDTVSLPSGCESLAAYRVETPIQVDGDVGEWGRRLQNDGVDMRHDGVFLYVSAVVTDTSPRLWNGVPFSLDGDWLELAFREKNTSFRIAVGLGPTGDGLVRSLTATPLPEALKVGVAYNATMQKTVYEIGIPIKWLLKESLPLHGGGVGCFVRAWESGGDAPRQNCLWGTVVGDGQPEILWQTIAILPDTQKGEEQLRQMVLNNPEQGVFWEKLYSGLRVRMRYAPLYGIETCRMVLKRFSQSMRVADLLVLIDRGLRSLAVQEPRDIVLGLAEKAGVPQPMRDWYRKQTESYLSQWVYYDSGNGKWVSTLDIGLFDGRSWHGRVLFGEVSPLCRESLHHSYSVVGGLMPPKKVWHELRIPLLALGYNNKPLCGISFRQRGNGTIYWGRTSIVANGNASVLIDESADTRKTPRNRFLNRWKWSAKFKKFDKQTHYMSPPRHGHDTNKHEVEVLRNSLAQHIVSPPDSPYLSVRVFLDSKKKVNSFGIGLLTNAWTDLFWGTPSSRRRCGGGMLASGKWHDVQIPLWRFNAYGSRIRGIRFMQENGQVFFDRVAVVAGGKTHVLIEDETPKGTVFGKWKWTEAQKASGTKSFTLVSEKRIENGVSRFDEGLIATINGIQRFPNSTQTLIRSWQVLGPFPNTNRKEFEKGVLHGAAVRLGRKWKGIDDKELAWKRVDLKEGEEKVNLVTCIAPLKNAYAYGVCWVHSKTGGAALIEAGSDDTLEVWLNEKLVHANFTARGVTVGEDRIPVVLKKGWNQVLVKVEQGDGEWGFTASVWDMASASYVQDTKAVPPEKGQN